MPKIASLFPDSLFFVYIELHMLYANQIKMGKIILQLMSLVTVFAFVSIAILKTCFLISVFKLHGAS